VTYSGTVSAAIEGALAGIRSIALSQVYAREGMGDTVPFAAAEAWGAEGARAADRHGDCRPHADQHQLSRAGRRCGEGCPRRPAGLSRLWRGSIVEGTDPRGYPYFWFGLHGIEQTPGHDTDLEAIGDGYISVTPLQVDLTHPHSLGRIADRLKHLIPD
jgi:5'-nucleotidase